MNFRAIAILLTAMALGRAGLAAGVPGPADQSRFVGVQNFSSYTESASTNGETVLLSPVIKAPIAWDQLVVSWNVAAGPEAAVDVEARGIYPDQTRFYTMSDWSLNGDRHSVRHQRDADGKVDTDTLILKHPGADVQLRLTLRTPSALKFIGLSFLDDRVRLTPPPTVHLAWGKIIATPERSQHGYPQEEGWCSPTSLSMVLARWGDLLHRPEMNLTVPAVAGAVYDSNFGTGNWPFNTAFAGSFPGMRAYITRFSDITELEQWINAGIPVIISAPWHLLSPGRQATGSGHLTVCIGFTATGDVVINDPATNLQKGQKVRHIYKRENVIKAWADSHDTVYLVYPEDAKLPPDHYGHWEGQ